MNKEGAFLDLVTRVKACQKCSRMGMSERVLSSACGPLTAPIVFVGEAPGRLGADESQIPFHGDKSGHNFESLLGQVGLSRYDVFVTNAVLCNPRDEAGNNATPTRTEIANCAPFLGEQIELVGPRVVVTLGATALKGCDLIASHKLVLSTAVRTANPWRGTTLIPVYHPGQRAMMHRSFANQLADYHFVAEVLRRGTKKKSSKVYGSSSAKVAAVVDRITAKKPKLSYFALHKLLFLAEVRQFEKAGKRLTAAYTVRQKDGPYCVELHPHKLVRAVRGLTVKVIRSKPFIFRERQPSLIDEHQTLLDASEIEIIDQVIEKYGNLSDQDLKRAVYMTRPMRDVLRRERAFKSNLFNSPLLQELPE